jgi:hypothetical protein
VPIPVFAEAVHHLCEDLVRIQKKFAGLYPAYLPMKVFLLSPGKGNELDAAPVAVAELFTPYEKPAPLAVDMFLEPDDAGLDLTFGFDSDAGHAEVDNFDTMLRPYEIFARNDAEAAVSIHNNGVSFYTLSSRIYFLFIHGLNSGVSAAGEYDIISNHENLGLPGACPGSLAP